VAEGAVLAVQRPSQIGAGRIGTGRIGAGRVGTGEAVAAELGLAAWGRTPADRTRWIAALAGHPVLIQRPIITADDGTTVIARTDAALQAVLPPARG
jgi:hypothetical protein